MVSTRHSMLLNTADEFSARAGVVRFALIGGVVSGYAFGGRRVVSQADIDVAFDRPGEMETALEKLDRGGFAVSAPIEYPIRRSMRVLVAHARSAKSHYDLACVPSFGEVGLLDVESAILPYASRMIHDPHDAAGAQARGTAALVRSPKEVIPHQAIARLVRCAAKYGMSIVGVRAHEDLISTMNREARTGGEEWWASDAELIASHVSSIVRSIASAADQVGLVRGLAEIGALRSICPSMHAVLRVVASKERTTPRPWPAAAALFRAMLQEGNDEWRSFVVGIDPYLRRRTWERWPELGDK